MKRILFFIVCCIFSMHCIFSQTLYIYGGEDHDVFLGKLNASKYDSKSIWNEYGTYGSEYECSLTPRSDYLNSCFYARKFQSQVPPF